MEKISTLLDPTKKHTLKVESHEGKTKIILDGVYLEKGCTQFKIEQESGSNVLLHMSHFFPDCELDVDVEDTEVRGK